MESESNLDLALRFVTSINKQNLDGLISLVTERHSFNAIDRQVSGIERDTMREVWRQYFEACPDYLIHLSEVLEREDLIILLIRTTGAFMHLLPSEEFQNRLIWTLQRSGELISALSIYPDNEETRRELGVG